MTGARGRRDPGVWAPHVAPARCAPPAARPSTASGHPPRPPASPLRTHRRARPRSPCRSAGYTLIEVLVAFAVLALALTLLLGTLSGASRQVRWAADSGRAALHAQSLLADVGVGVALQPGRDEGEFDEGRYRWSLEVAPFADPQRPPAPLDDPFAPRLMQLRLAVAWGQGGPAERLQVDSLRLVQPDPVVADALQ